MAPPQKWWVRAMGAAKWIRFAVLLSFAGLFGWLAYIRGEVIWLLPLGVFILFALLTLRR
ncbi:MAG: hypothetical protein KF748_02515 [Xanthobacteraceae bacterium]|nr:hypothetical protein [Xanthobacteraceae bacterium]